jgi:hypothetical protein
MAVKKVTHDIQGKKYGNPAHKGAVDQVVALAGLRTPDLPDQSPNLLFLLYS